MEEIIILLLLLMQLEFIVVTYLMLRKKRPSRQQEGMCFIDTSALIDGRIVDVARAGFVPGRLAIPRSVLKELQLLADGADGDKRARARHGLDVARTLQEIDHVSVEIIDDEWATGGVDERLLQLAAEHHGSICTIDYNLNKVAKAERLAVLNVNELAKNLRMNFLPGERVSILLTQKGNDAHQGVGYMADGTMVVVEKAKADIGKTVNIEFIRSIQTDAGRMLFAKKVGQDAVSRSAQPQSSKKPANNNKPASRRSNTAKPAGKAPRKSPEASLVELANQ